MATDKVSEQEIQLRKRARRRLVGAVALVLLMVTVLPMILDDRQAQTPQQEIAVTIPSQDNSDFASRIVPVDPASETAAPESPPAAVPPQPPAPVQEPQAALTPPAPPPPPVPAPAKPVAEEKPAPVEKSTIAEKPAEKSVVADKPAGNSQAFAVQIGVFSDAANVKQLQARLAAQGYKTYTEKVTTAGGQKTRLRIGPYPSRADAEKAHARLKAAGTSGMVVAQ